jgi:hypothetical protein
MERIIVARRPLGARECVVCTVEARHPAGVEARSLYGRLQEIQLRRSRFITITI